MPVPLIKQVIIDGIGTIPYAYQIIKAIAVVGVLYLLKTYFQGASNRSERNMHGKVVMVTGGTSGIGAEVVRGLASRGAQIVLLTQHPITDPFLVDYIDDLRTDTATELITAEQVDLSDLHSIRTFATKWIDNAPPRRLDMIVLCANTLTPRGGQLQSTEDGVEVNWAVNYLANFHLLGILSPALRAQPPDRDVRVIMGTCVSYVYGELPVGQPGSADGKGKEKKPEKQAAGTNKAAAEQFRPHKAYAASKLAVMTFAQAFQKHLSSYARPDKKPMNTRVILVDPGFCRTPGMRRYLSWGSLVGLVLYLVTYPLWWLLLKSPDRGAESFLYAAMEAKFGRGEGGLLVKECMDVPIRKADIMDEGVQKALWESSEGAVQEAEKRGAKRRAEMKAAEAKKEQEAAKNPDQDGKKAVPEKQAGSRRSKKA